MVFTPPLPPLGSESEDPSGLFLLKEEKTRSTAADGKSLNFVVGLTTTSNVPNWTGSLSHSRANLRQNLVPSDPLRCDRRPTPPQRTGSLLPVRKGPHQLLKVPRLEAYHEGIMNGGPFSCKKSLPPSDKTVEVSASSTLRYASKLQRRNDCDNSPTSGGASAGGAEGVRGNPSEGKRKMSSSLKGFGSPLEKSVTFSVTDTIRRRVPCNDEGGDPSVDAVSSLKKESYNSFLSEKEPLYESAPGRTDIESRENRFIRQTDVATGAPLGAKGRRELVSKRSCRHKVSSKDRILAKLRTPAEEVAIRGNKEGPSGTPNSGALRFQLLRRSKYRHLRDEKSKTDDAISDGESGHKINRTRSSFLSKTSFGEAKRKNESKLEKRKNGGGKDDLLSLAETTDRNLTKIDQLRRRDSDSDGDLPNSKNLDKRNFLGWNEKGQKDIHLDKRNVLGWNEKGQRDISLKRYNDERDGKSHAGISKTKRDHLIDNLSAKWSPRKYFNCQTDRKHDEYKSVSNTIPTKKMNGGGACSPCLRSATTSASSSSPSSSLSPASPQDALPSSARAIGEIATSASGQPPRLTTILKLPDRGTEGDELHKELSDGGAEGVGAIKGHKGGFARNESDIQIRLMNSKEDEYVEITFFSPIESANPPEQFVGKIRTGDGVDEKFLNRVTDPSSGLLIRELLSDPRSPQNGDSAFQRHSCVEEGFLRDVSSTEDFSDFSPAEGLPRDGGNPVEEQVSPIGIAGSVLSKGLNSFVGLREASAGGLLGSSHLRQTKPPPQKYHKIYTDWANHYLEKSRSRRHISDLQTDVTDGIILADVIEAVTGQKVPDLNRKPKSSGQMLDNVTAALNFLGALGVQLDRLDPKDIRDGNLKSILSLFFALSRYKQQQKQAHQERKELEKLREKKQESEMAATLVSRLGSPYKGQNGCGSAIPTPALGGRKQHPGDHSRGTSRSATPSGVVSGPQLKGINSTSSSRSASPSNGSASFIPTPRGHSGNRGSTHNDKIRQNSCSGSGSNRSSIRGLPSSGVAHPTKQKDSMLEKLRLFNKDKDSKSHKNSNSSGVSSGVSKRTSSSSGFSSARSEKSDSSSTSLCSDTKPPPLPPHQNFPGSTSSSSSDQAPSGYQEQFISPKSSGLRAFRSRLSRSKEGKESPKSNRRSEDRDSAKGSPKSSHRSRSSSETKESRNHSNKKAETLTLNLTSNESKVPEIALPSLDSKSSKIASDPSGGISLPPPKSPGASSPAQSLLPNASTTGIPKPTAAVKGTTKSPTIEKGALSSSIGSIIQKDYQNKMLRTSPTLYSPTSPTLYSPTSPTPAVRKPPIGCEAPAKPENCETRDAVGSLPRQRNLGGRRDDGGGPSIAMVSPMPIKNQVSGSESGSALSEASHTSGHSTSSGGSSVIFKPLASAEEETEELKSQEAKGEESDEIQPMLPILGASQYGYIRRFGAPTHNLSDVHLQKLNFQENPYSVSQKGMKIAPPHLAPPHLRLSRLNKEYVVNPEYTDLECMELASGYLSEGELLRPMSYSRGQDPDGYTSEGGGASVYAVRLNQRLQEGMRQVHESLSKVQHFFQDDSFDDSSSLSSGVSDTLNELSEDLLTCSPEQQTNFAKARGKDLGLKLPIGLSLPSPRKAAMGMDPSGAYKVISSKAHVKKTESAQPQDTFKQISNTQWKKYVDQSKANCSGVDYDRTLELNGSKNLDHRKTADGVSVVQSMVDGGSHQRKAEKRVLGHQKVGPIVPISLQLNGEAKKIQNPKMVPINFKRTGTGAGSGSNKSFVSKPPKDCGSPSGSRDGSSHSLDRPRTKLKVSGGTQTTSDLQFMPTTGFHSDGEYSSGSLGRKYHQMKSYSLNGPAASHLSQGVRERILQSPYRKVHLGGDINSYMGGVYYRERGPRMKPSDGSLSDSPYTNYGEMQYGGVNPYGHGYSWISRGNYPGNIQSTTSGHVEGVANAESLESVDSLNSPSFPPYAAHLLAMEKDLPLPLIARSSSTRSTKSEKVLGIREGYHSSQPTSPTPHSSRLPMSPLNSSRSSPYYTPLIISRSGKDDECHGSSLSLVSSSSSMYSSQEDKQATELRKLKKDLSEAKERVLTLTNQLTTNAHVVAAFEQSLTNMTNRLHQLTTTSEKKDSQLTELRKTIDSLRQQSIEAGLTVARLQSRSHDRRTATCAISPPTNASATPPATSTTSSSPHPHPASNNASCSAINTCTISPLGVPSAESPQQAPAAAAPNCARRHTFTGACRDIAAAGDAQVPPRDGGKLVRGSSAESVSSMSSACSGNSHRSSHDRSDNSKSGKKKGWLRSSFTKAFSRTTKAKQKSNGGSDVEESRDLGGELSVPASPVPARDNGEAELQQPLEESDKQANEKSGERLNASEEIVALKRQLWEKDMVLTDIRLEALTSAHQLESLKETLGKMRVEMKTLKEKNDRLQRVTVNKSLDSSRTSLPISEPVVDRRLSLSEDIITIEDSTDVLLIDPLDKDSKRVTVSVLFGCHSDPAEGSGSECVVGAISISGKTKWDTLDSLVKRILKEFLLRVDPSSNLGINSDSILSYRLGEISRGKTSVVPELLPCGYLVGEVTKIQVVLRGATMNCVDALAFGTLTSKSIIQRWISLLTEHRRIILSGSSGTGKSFYARKLAEFLVCRSGKEPNPENIATFNVDHRTSKDLGAYLSHISERCENNTSDLPMVIILDNLHFAGALTEVFNGFLSAKYSQCPFIIGTMVQTTSCSTTNLQLHHNFRWVLIANHMEPVKGLLGKISRRKLTHVEVETFSRQPRLQQALDWLPKCWSHINKFLESHSSSDVTLGPRLFLSCPGSVEVSQVWFTDLWNFSLVPYMIEAVREGLQLYGKRASWEDPMTWIQETYPWPNASVKALVGLRPEDVGYDTVPLSGISQEKPKSDLDIDKDPLLSMLMRLQEAADFSSPLQDTASVSIENMENALESTL